VKPSVYVQQHWVPDQYQAALTRSHSQCRACCFQIQVSVSGIRLNQVQCRLDAIVAWPQKALPQLNVAQHAAEVLTGHEPVEVEKPTLLLLGEGPCVGQGHWQQVITILAGCCQQSCSPLTAALLPWGFPSDWAPTNAQEPVNEPTPQQSTSHSSWQCTNA